MALPVLVTRPEKTIDSSLSQWNAAALPLQYDISNTKFPTNSEDDIDTISSVSDNSGFAQIVLASTSEIYKVKESVKIAGTTSYNGIQKIRAINGLNITIDAPFIADETGTLQRSFANYTSIVRVFAGLPPTHEFAYFKELRLIGTIEQRPNTDNTSPVDVRKYVADNLNTFNDVDQSSFPNDLNLWTGFYIEWAERYDQVLSGSVLNFTSVFQTDLANIVFASHSALQFQNVNGGNMSLHLLGGSVYKETLTKFMTDFDRPKLFLSSYFDISIINAAGDFLFIDEFDINNTLINQQTKVITNNDVGVYRIRLDQFTYNASTDHIEIQIKIPDFLPEDLVATAVDDDQIDLAWTNEVDDRQIEVFRDSVLITTLPAATTSFSNTGLARGTQFCYTLKYEGAISSSNESCATTFNSFEFQVVTNNPGGSNNDQYVLPLIASGTYNCLVRWGDGSEDTITTHNQAETTHTYTAAGTKTIKISGTCVGWAATDTPNTADPQKITDISFWGTLQPSGNGSVFEGCSNLDVTATDIIDLTQITEMGSFFTGCSSLVFNSSINSWDTSLATGMSLIFNGCSSFNQPIGSWDVSGVTTFFFAFNGCTVFNQNITSWNVGAVIDMRAMFENCIAFNQAIGGWNVGLVTDMSTMFRGCAAFNSSIDAWDVSSVTTMGSMFRQATIFNQALNSWVTTALIDISSMFNAASAFNQNISSWDVSGVTNMSATFASTPFNQDISSWDVSAVTNFSNMFISDTAFNQDISGWTTTALTTTIAMFSGATAFEQNIGSWDVTGLTNATSMFNGVTLTTANYDALLVGWEGQAVQDNVVFSGGNSNFTSAGAGGTARAALISDHTWTITDGGGV